MMTLFGLSTTRLAPMAAAISRLNGVSESNAILARSSPAASETRLIGPPGASGTGSAAAAIAGAEAAANLDAATAAAPPSNDVLRKLLRDLWHSVVMAHTLELRPKYTSEVAGY
jgi:hypothetical protein